MSYVTTLYVRGSQLLWSLKFAVHHKARARPHQNKKVISNRLVSYFTTIQSSPWLGTIREYFNGSHTKRPHIGCVGKLPKIQAFWGTPATADELQNYLFAYILLERKMILWEQLMDIQYKAKALTTALERK